MCSTISIQSALRSATETLGHCSTSARVDAEALILHTLKKTRSYIRAWPEKNLTTWQSTEFEKLVESRAQGTPVAYLTGIREFWSREFEVNPEVLIPRHETELLIELALSLIPTRQNISILELGTGSGAIAVTLAAERPDSNIIATDISSTALQVAARNASRHKASNIEFRTSNWFDQLDNTLYDMILSNPPYVAENDTHLNQGDLVFEPKIALQSGPQGLDALTIIAARSGKKLLNGGHLIVEHGYQQYEIFRTLLNQFNYQNIQAYTDLQGHKRLTHAQMTVSAY